MGSKKKVESINGIDVSGDNYPCGIMENKNCDSTGLSTESSLGLEESNGLSGDLARCWEVEQEGPQVTDVQGCLWVNLDFWEKVIEAPPPVIECIKEGYKLPLLSIPEQYMDPNHRSARQNQEFVTSAVADLLKNRYIREVKGVPYVCSPLSAVVSNSQKKRLVMDLRYLNQHLLQAKFKYEDLRLAMTMFEKGDFMFSFDLKAGYHHVDIHEEYWQYLGFAWDDGGAPKYYMFVVLPFGLATKLLRPLTKFWRGQGLRAIIYLDDGIVSINGRKAAEQASQHVRGDQNSPCAMRGPQPVCWSECINSPCTGQKYIDSPCAGHGVQTAHVLVKVYRQPMCWSKCINSPCAGHSV